MKALLQRVTSASVAVEGAQVARIGSGLLVLLGVGVDDGMDNVERLADKVLGLRIFADGDKAMNRSVVDVAGELLVVSQFTLAADTRKGKRPGFSTAAPPERAQPLYEAFVSALQARYQPVQTGVFGADMQVQLTNDGPVTFLLDL